jgi:hypothetical protein
LPIDSDWTTHDFHSFIRVKTRLVLTSQCEHVNLLIVAIGYVNATVSGTNGLRIHEFGFATTMLSDLKHKIIMGMIYLIREERVSKRHGFISTRE